MDDVAVAILASLDRVELQRRVRSSDPSLANGVEAIKRYQHARFGATYIGFLQDAATAPAARFFLNELYGPGDFSLRDQQFRRIVPGLAGFFPSEVAMTVLELSKLHALSEELDGAMGMAARGKVVDGENYGRFWRLVGRPDHREEQIRLMLDIGTAIDKLARQPLLRASLKLMRGPASAAGFGALQGFLERGLTAFRALKEPKKFLETIAATEREIAAQLFANNQAGG